ncbi:MAG: EamA family transporter [Candidatus Altiarchaeota archaeon]
MDDWLIFGLTGAVLYAVSGLATKVLLDKRYMGLNAADASILVATGVTIGFLAFYLIFAGAKIPQVSPKAALVGVAVGLFWAMGSIAVYYGLLKGAEVSKMAPIYNLNTLLVVLGGIILLHELPDRTQALKVIAGAVLITAGGILVST